MSKYKCAFDTRELEIYGDAEESFRRNSIAYGEVVAPPFGRCKNYYDSWERVMQRQTERHIVAKKLKSRGYARESTVT